MKNRKAVLLILLIQGSILFGYSQQRNVLVEQFTNSGCPTCAGNTPLVASYVNMNSSTTLMLSHHTSFPYLDSMYFENAQQSNQRVAYYSIAAVPNSRVDGNVFAGNLVPVLSSVIPARLLIIPRYQISFISATLTNKNIMAVVQFISDDAANSNENLVAHIVVTEKKVLKSSYICCAGANSETQYPWVVRHMLPDAAGTALINKSFGGIDLVGVSWNANNIKDFNEVRITAFVQNISTKEVYQAEIAPPLSVTAITNNYNNSAPLFSVRNPVSNGIFQLTFPHPLPNQQLNIFDVTGNIIYKETLAFAEGVYVFQKNLSPGIYFIGLESGNGKYFQKVILM